MRRNCIKEGASIVIADMNEPLAKQVAAEMGERAVAIAVNVSDEESVAHMVAQTVELFGGLDLMLSNAGVVRSGPLAQVEKKDFDFVTSVNYTGFFLCAKYAAIIMEAEHEADPEAMFDIVTLNSKSGLEGSNKNFAYAGSKFGGIGLTQSFALELCAYNIKVNAVSAPATSSMDRCGPTRCAVCSCSISRRARSPARRPSRTCAGIMRRRSR